MKRLIVLLVVFLMASTAFAEGLNFSSTTSMTDDELKTAFFSIVEELTARGIWVSEKIPSGFYVVGKTLPVGNYEFTALKHGTIEIFPSLEDCEANTRRVKYQILDEGDGLILTLEENMTVDLSCECKIKPFSFAW